MLASWIGPRPSALEIMKIGKHKMRNTLILVPEINIMESIKNLYFKNKTRLFVKHYFKNYFSNFFNLVFHTV